MKFLQLPLVYLLLFTLVSIFLLIDKDANAQALSGGTTYAINGTSSSSSFTTLQSAASYAAANGVTGTGNVIFQFQTGYNPSSEPATGIFLDSVPGVNSTRGIIIRPATGFTVSISGNDSAKGLINFRNCMYYTIDGRQGGTGTSTLGFTNISTSLLDTTCTVRFMNGASNNVIRYCLLQGASKSVYNGGVVLFSSGNASSGNNFNTIEYCNIDGTSNAHNGIVGNTSMSSTNVENTSDTIRLNNIYDMFDNAGASGNSGIRLQTGANSWYISGNSIFQSATRTFTLNNLHYGILIGEGGYWTSDSHIITGNWIGGSAAQCVGTMNLTASTGVCGYVAIYMYDGNNTTVSGNTIKNISVTYSSASGSYSNAAIFSTLKYGGTINILNNTIDTTLYVNSAGSTLYFGIYASTTIDTTFVKNFTPTYYLTNNTLKNITIGSNLTALTTQLFAIRVAASSVASQGTTTYFNNTLFSVNGNTIDGIRSNGSSTSSMVVGIYANAANGSSSSQAVRIYPSYINNTIRNLFCNGTITSIGNAVAGGIVVLNSVSGTTVYSDTVKVRNNTIYNLFAQNPSDLSTMAGGILLNGGKVDVSRNKIYNIYNAGNGVTNTPCTFGVNILTLLAASSADNNFISLGDTSTSNQSTYGIINGLAATSSINLYNNSVLISGSSSNKNSAAILRGDPVLYTGLTTPFIIKNNLLINRRTGSGINVALGMPGVSPFTSDNNTFLTPTGSVMGYYSSSTNTFATWKTNTLNDIYSYAALITSSTSDFTVNPPAINLSDLFANANYSSAANMLVDNTKPTCWILFGKGASIPGYLLDFNSSSRTGVTGLPVCIGGNEFTTSVTPPNNFIVGNYFTNDSVTASFCGRDLLRLIWTGGTLPSSLISRYYSGSTTLYPPGNVSASYWTAWATGGSGYTYTVKIFYGSHEKGTIVNSNSTTGLSFRAGVGWNYPVGTADTTKYPQVAMVGGRTQVLTSITNSAFALSDYVNSIPVKLVEFWGKINELDVILNWSTSSELNASYFGIERSFDNQNFEEIGQIEAIGNSIVTEHYMFVDRDAASLNQKVIYYRLRQVDADGKFTYSAIVTVRFDVKNIHEINIIPNPFNNKVTIGFSENPLTIRITDICGKLIMECNASMVINHAITLDLQILEQGVYFVNLVYKEGMVTRKLMKQGD